MFASYTASDNQSPVDKLVKYFFMGLSAAGSIFCLLLVLVVARRWDALYAALDKVCLCYGQSVAPPLLYISGAKTLVDHLSLKTLHHRKRILVFLFVFLSRNVKANSKGSFVMRLKSAWLGTRFSKLFY